MNDDLKTMLTVAAALKKAPASWKHENPLARWKGLKTKIFDGKERVVGLSIERGNGTLAPELGNLAHLRELVISAEKIQGSLPKELEKLHNLESLHLVDNASLSGPIPDIWKGLENLKTLEIYANPKFETVALPASIGKLKNLRSVRLSRVDLKKSLKPLSKIPLLEDLMLVASSKNDRVPDWIFDHPRLRSLVLHSFKIQTIPESIGRMTPLERLSLQGCGLASIPESLENLQNLKRIEFMANNLRNIPACILKLGALSVLLLTGNFIASPLPDELFAMNLEYLSLDHNRLSGPLPEGFGRMTNLKLLSLGGNGFTESVPQGYAHLEKLETLILRGNMLDAETPRWLTAMNIKRLEYQPQQRPAPGAAAPADTSADRTAMLEILSELPWHHESWQAETPLEKWRGLTLQKIDGHMQVTELKIENAKGRLSPAIGKLRHLKKLEFWCSDIQGEFPEELGNLSNLEFLKIDQAGNMASFLPESIGNLRSLQSLTLRTLPLTTLPQSLGNLPSLEELEIWNCPISDLPESIGNLKSLQDLRIFDAPITGLPESFGSLTGLKSLTIMRCKLEEIPTVVGKLSSLTSLALGSNEISGPLPAFLFDLPLSTLLLQENHLSGSIPDAICKLPLRNLVLRDNHFTGQVPSCLKDREFYTIDFDGNDLTMDTESQVVFDEIRFDTEHPFLRYKKEPAEDDSACEGPLFTLYGAAAPFRLCEDYGGDEWRSKDRRANFWGDIQNLYVELFFDEPCSQARLKKLLPMLKPAMDEAMRKAEALPRKEMIAAIADLLYDIMREEVDAMNAEITDPRKKVFLPEREKLGDIFFATSVHPRFFIGKNDALTHKIHIGFETYEYYLGNIYLNATIADGKLTGVEQQ